MSCRDGNPCTVDLCSEGGLSEAANQVNCDDGCPAAKPCTEGECSGIPLFCNDGNPCTVDFCAFGNANCTFAPAVGASCTDGDSCTLSDTCSLEGCSGTPLLCDDGLPCNGEEVCSMGGCEPGPIPECGDGSLDTECGEVCDDGNEIDGDGCSRLCQPEGVPCLSDDECEPGGPCIAAWCNGALGVCQFLELEGECQGSDPCWGPGLCVDGTCAGGEPLLCNDGISCTVDSCVAGSCFFTPENAFCPDDSSCLKGLCDIAEGCIAAPVIGLPCDDGDPCTIEDGCSETGCEGKDVLCDDLNPCTSDTCMAAQGCIYGDHGPTVFRRKNALEDTCEEGVQRHRADCGDVDDSFCVLEPAQAENGELECPLSIARASEGLPPATALQFSMTYPPEQYEFLGVFSSICFDSVGCFELPVAGEGAVPLSTGHTLSMAPLTIAGWKGIPCASDGECAKECNQGTCSNTGGFGGLILVHVSAPDTPLNQSFLLPSGAVSEPSVPSPISAETGCTAVFPGP